MTEYSIQLFRFKNGETVIAETANHDEKYEHYEMYRPMKIHTEYDGTGKTVILIYPLIPLSMVDQETFFIKKDIIGFTAIVTEEMQKMYLKFSESLYSEDVKLKIGSEDEETREILSESYRKKMN